MRSLFRRFRHDRVTPLEAELLAARPQPPERLVESIVATVRPRSGARPARLRIAFAGGLTVALVAVVAAIGGFSHAASAIVHATRVAQVTGAKPSPPPVVAVSSACSQYAVAPIITGFAPTSGPVGTSVVITGSHFSAPSAITGVFFGGVSASFTINSDTQLTAIVPATAQTGVITVTNCKGSATGGTFTVTTSKTVSWTGNGSGSVTKCSRGQSPYLHWIFTTGGSKSVTGATLTLGGSGSGNYPMSQHGGSWTVNTNYYNLATLTAYVTYTGTLGNVTANLVISGGCFA